MKEQKGFLESVLPEPPYTATGTFPIDAVLADATLYSNSMDGPSYIFIRNITYYATAFDGSLGDSTIARELWGQRQYLQLRL